MKILDRSKSVVLSLALLLSLVAPSFSDAAGLEHVDRDGRADEAQDTHAAGEARQLLSDAALQGLGIVRQDLMSEAKRYKGDQANRASLEALLRAALENQNPEVKSALQSYLAIVKKGGGRFSVYPLELKQILDTWPQEKAKVFLDALSSVSDSLDASQARPAQDLFEDALKAKGLLSDYRANKTIVSLQALDGLQLDPVSQGKLNELAASLQASQGDVKTVLSSIFLEISKSGLSDLKKSDKMATAGNKIVKIAASLDDESQRKVAFAVGTCVIRLEEFQREEFVKEPFILTTDTDYPHKHFTEYASWAKSFVKGTAAYANGRDGGLLTVKDIRDMSAQNEWPVGMRPHDTRHIHYAVGHPRGVALMFESSRSKNTLRTRLLAAMYESVDTIQYWYESRLSSYFRDKGMDLEQGLLFVGRANDATLKKVWAEATNNDDMDISEVRDWRMPVSGKYDGLGKTGIGFEAETDAMVRNLLLMGQNPANRSWMNYDHTIDTGAGSVPVDDATKH